MATISLTSDLLVELGFTALTRSQAGELLHEVYNTLETLVGHQLAAKMNEDQIRKFEYFINSSDEPGALSWLETNFPDYQEEVRRLFKAIENDLLAVVRNYYGSNTTSIDAG